MSQRFMPGESSGVPDELWRKRYPFLRTYGLPRRGSMELRTGEQEGFAPPPLSTNPVVEPGAAGLALHKRPEALVPADGPYQEQFDLDQPPPQQPAPVINSDAAQSAIQKPDARIAKIGTLLPQSTPELQALLTRRKEIEQAPPHQGRWGGLLEGARQGILGAAQRGATGFDVLAAGAGGAGAGVLTPKGMGKVRQRREVGEVDTQIAQQLGIETAQAKIQETLADAAYKAMGPKRTAPTTQTRVVGEGEYPDTPAGSAIRQVYDSTIGEFVDDVGQDKRPVVVRAPREGRSTPHESTRVVEDGEYEGVPAGTAIKRLWNGKEYVDEIRNGKPVVAAESTRTTTQETETAKRDAATRSAQSAHERGEDHLNKRKEIAAEVSKLKGELRKLKPDPAKVVVDPLTLKKIINDLDYFARKSELEDAIKLAQDDSKYRQSEADKAFRERDDFKREAGAIPAVRGAVKPAKDGKYHYTPDQIRAALKPGQVYEDVLRQLKERPNVVIDK